MASKRKAARAHGDQPSPKRRSAPSSPSAPSPPVAHPLLQQFYPAVLTLRQYLAIKLAATSNRKHRKVAHLACSPALCVLLDQTWVGCSPALSPDVQSSLDRDLDDFSQETTASSSDHPELQSEIVHFVIRSLFKKYPNHQRPPHVLCRGFQRASFAASVAPPGLSGIVSLQPNCHVETLKRPPWSELLVVLGHGGDSLMIELLMSCGIFVVLQGSCGNCYQLSGTPLTDIDPTTLARPLQNHCGRDKPSNPAAEAEAKRHAQARDNLTSIRFVRSRILYARAALNARGRVRFGLRHIHVFNRFSDHASFTQTIHVMKHIFPRQFGLHNVFTSKIDHRETSHPFKDYTLREKEIAHAQLRKMTKLDTATGKARDAIPKRLRGQAVDLVRRLRTLHNRCAYVELLRHYCHSNIVGEPQGSVTMLDSTVPFVEKDQDDDPSNPTQASQSDRATLRPVNASSIDKVCFTDFATSSSQVSAFCRAVMKNVIPHQFWGDGEVQEHNKRVFLKHVDRFVRVRRNESLTLHEVLQDIKVRVLDGRRV
ncbi:uncharacterized protein IWZ02DRAFT_131593 [Phyllosticta citriasiana]|uniref:uncharacterized protein n=1 Tax=Phyllosticta citriasiana TaxID=595635 RepID=UPI0030FDBD3E